MSPLLNQASVEELVSSPIISRFGICRDVQHLSYGASHIWEGSTSYILRGYRCRIMEQGVSKGLPQLPSAVHGGGEKLCPNYARHRLELQVFRDHAVVIRRVEGLNLGRSDPFGFNVPEKSSAAFFCSLLVCMKNCACSSFLRT